MSEDINSKIRAYLEKNPESSIRDIVDTFNVNYNVAAGVRQRFVKARIIKEYKAQQEVNTPEGYKGSLVRGKMWQVYDGSWREPNPRITGLAIPPPVDIEETPAT